MSIAYCYMYLKSIYSYYFNMTLPLVDNFGINNNTLEIQLEDLILLYFFVI